MRKFFTTIYAIVSISYCFAQLPYDTLGTSGNYYTIYEGSVNRVHYNEELDVTIFIHRADPNVVPGATTANFVYDIKQGNGPWQINKDSILLNPSGDNVTTNTRFPNVVTYNPSGVADLDSTYLIYLGSVNDYIGSTTWDALSAGVIRLDNEITTRTDSIYTATDLGLPNLGFVGDLCTGADGIFWAASPSIDPFVGEVDKIIVYKGTWNNTIKDVSWEINQVFTPPFDRTLTGTSQFAGVSMAFDPTGRYGYVTFNADIEAGGDNVLKPSYYVTTNGGTIWDGPFVIETNEIPEVMRRLNNPSSDIPTTGFDLETSVDTFGSLHCVSVIGQSGGNYAIQVTTAGAKLNIYDIVVDTFENFECFPAFIHLDSIATFQREIAVGTNAFEYNRPQISRNATGSVINIGWQDSDPVLVGGRDNTLPNLKMRSYYPSTGYATDVKNITEGDVNFNGQAFSISFAPTSKSIPGTNPHENYVPVVIGQINPLTSSDLDPANFFFLDSVNPISAPLLDVYPPDFLGLTGLNPDTVIQGSPYIDGGVSGSDNSGMPITSWVDTSTLDMNTPGTYQVTISAQDAAGNISCDQQQRTVVVLPIFEVELGSDVDLCGGNVTVTANPVRGTPPFSYLWPGLIDTTASVTISQPGVYVVQATDADLFVSFDTIGVAPCASCVVDASITQAGIHPDTLPCVEQGNYFEETLQFFNFDSIFNVQALFGASARVDSIKLTSLIGLPDGMSFVCSNANNVFSNQERGCITVYGTPTEDVFTYSNFTAFNNTFRGHFRVTGTLYLNVAPVGPIAFPLDSILAAEIGLIDSFTYANSGFCNPGGPLSVSILGNTNICIGTTTTLTASVSGGTPTYNYAWSSGGSGPSITVGAGTHSVTVTDDFGATATQFVNVTTTMSIPPCIALDVSAGNDTAICLGQSVTLTATPTGGFGAYSYLWLPNSEATQSITVTDSGTYSVIVFDTTGNSMQSNVRVSYTTLVPPCPSGPLSISLGNDTTICQFNQLQIKANAFGGTGNYTFAWSNGSPFSNIFVQPTAPTTYKLTLTDGVNTVVDSIKVTPTLAVPPCTGSYFITGKVVDPNGAPVPSGTVTLYDISNTIAGYDTLGFTTLDTGGRYTFAFSAPLFRSVTMFAKPDGAIYPDLLPTYLGDSVKWNDAASYYSDTSNQPVPNIKLMKITQVGGAIVGGSNAIRGTILTNIVGKSANPIEDEDIILNQTPPGLPVAYTKTSSSGGFFMSGLGTATYEIVADVAGIPMNTLTNNITFYGTNDTINLIIIVDSSVITVDAQIDTINAIQEWQAEEVKLYPNPTSGRLFIDLGQYLEQVQVSITDVTGKTVHQQITNAERVVPVDLELAPGVYFVTLQADRQATRVVKRLVVQ